jgi:hypothetical protein
MKESKTSQMDFDEGDPDALDVLLKILHGFEELEPTNYVKEV